MPDGQSDSGVSAPSSHKKGLGWCHFLKIAPISQTIVEEHWTGLDIVNIYLTELMLIKTQPGSEGKPPKHH